MQQTTLYSRFLNGSSLQRIMWKGENMVVRGRDLVE